MSDVKISYLLGAGASANALPTIKKVTDKSDSSKGLSNELKEFVVKESSSFIFRGYTEFTDKKLIEITENCIEFGTPDLYAKFLLEKSRGSNYELLVRLISNYFIYKETVQYARDKRALAFMTMVADQRKFPSNLSIVSWNYDNQIELAAKELKYSTNQPYMENFRVWPNDEERSDNPYTFVHINGVSGYKYDTRNLAIQNKDWRLFDDSINPLISFSWEIKEGGKYGFLDQRIDLAKKAMKGSSILVIVGYSFPFFNRKIDNELIEVLRPTLKKIYFQDPFNNGNFLYERFNWLEGGIDGDLGVMREKSKIPIKHISNCDQYFIPVEL